MLKYTNTFCPNWKCLPCKWFLITVYFKTFTWSAKQNHDKTAKWKIRLAIENKLWSIPTGPAVSSAPWVGGITSCWSFETSSSNLKDKRFPGLCDGTSPLFILFAVAECKKDDKTWLLVIHFLESPHPLIQGDWNQWVSSPTGTGRREPVGQCVQNTTTITQTKRIIIFYDYHCTCIRQESLSNKHAWS